MKKFLCVILYFSISSAWAQMGGLPIPGMGTDISEQILSRCAPASRNLIALQRYHLPALSERRDVSLQVDRLNLAYKSCSLLPRELIAVKAELELYKKRGFESEYRRAKIRAQNYSRYNAVDEHIEKMKQYRQRAGISENQFNLDVSNYLSKGKTAALSAKKNCDADKVIDNRIPELGPVRDQDGIGWCYAFASADLISHKLKKRVSAIDIAMLYNRNKTPIGEGVPARQPYREQQDIEGGHQRRSIKYILQRGWACLESEVRSDDLGVTSLEEAMDRLSSAKSKIGILNCYNSDLTFFPGLNILDSISVFNNSTKYNYIEKLRDKACQTHVSVKDLKSKGLSSEGLQENKIKLFDKIDEQLGRGNIVSISYQSTILDNKLDVSTGGANHASTIVGKRWNEVTNSCDYLIRNSLGQGCAGYDESLDCEGGNIWVPKQNLSIGLSRVNYLD